MGRTVEAPQEAARLGSYEIVRKLARGGMAELFLARTVGPEGFAKLVVLKKILPNYAANPKFVRLFLDEAKLVAQMEHPHIAQVYDMGKAGNDFFFTMEYVHGQDVRAIWRRAQRMGKLVPLDHAVQIARNIAAALHYAHERTRDDGSLLDIVHRDVSPSNILLSYEGATKLVDFGVAKAATSTVKTRTGALKGKIAYMSPEQAKGAPIDRRSDIFSLGIVVWELVTGRRLYKAENDLATIQMIINSKPQPPSQVRPDCPAGLDTIIARALDAEVPKRYQNAEQMQLDLEKLARDNRWDQSVNSLRAYMHELFEAELKVWMDAHTQGETLIEHVLKSSPTVILPASDSDASEEEGDDDVVDDASQADSLADSDVLTSAPSTAPGELPPTAPRRAIVDEMQTLTNESDEATQFPTRKLQLTPPATIQLSVPPPPQQRPRSEPVFAPEMPGPDDATLHDGVPPFAPAQHAGALPVPPAGFPVAPAEWRRDSEPVPSAQAGHEVITRHVLIACSVLIAIITLFAIAFGGGSDRRAAARAVPRPMLTPPAAPAEKVEMRVVPDEP